METNVKVLGWIYIVLGIIGLLCAFVLLAVLLGAGLIITWAEGGREAPTILAIVGGVVMFITFLLSVPGIVAGAGLIKYKPWARILTLVLGFLNLPGFPLGTVLGIYTLVVLLGDDATALFERVSAS